MIIINNGYVYYRKPLRSSICSQRLVNSMVLNMLDSHKILFLLKCSVTLIYDYFTLLKFECIRKKSTSIIFTRLSILDIFKIDFKKETNNILTYTHPFIITPLNTGDGGSYDYSHFTNREVDYRNYVSTIINKLEIKLSV